MTGFPTIAGIEAARAELDPYLEVTPLLHAEVLSRALGAEVWLKYETASPVASYKLRGALVDLMRAGRRGELAGAVAASSGNLGQGVAYAARLSGFSADIFVDRGVNALKRTMIEAFGGRVHRVGRDVDEAREAAIAFAAERGRFFVNDGMSLDMMEGTATVGLEIARALPGVEVVLVPMGGGNLAAGVAAALAALAPGARVVAVQAEAAPAIAESFHARRPIEIPGASVAGGLVSRVPVAFALEVLWRFLDDAWLVSEGDILAAVHTLMESAHVLVEPSGGVALAAAWRHREALRGKRVVLLLTGANISVGELGQALGTEPFFAPGGAGA